MAFCFKVIYFVKIWWEWLRAWTSDKIRASRIQGDFSPLHAWSGRAWSPRTR